MTTAESLARFIVATPHSEVPEYVRTLSKMVAVSTVASAAAGYNLRSAEIIRDLPLQASHRRTPSQVMQLHQMTPIPEIFCTRERHPAQRRSQSQSGWINPARRS